MPIRVESISGQPLRFRQVGLESKEADHSPCFHAHASEVLAAVYQLWPQLQGSVCMLVCICVCMCLCVCVRFERLCVCAHLSKQTDVLWLNFTPVQIPAWWWLEASHQYILISNQWCSIFHTLCKLSMRRVSWFLGKCSEGKLLPGSGGSHTWHPWH